MVRAPQPPVYVFLLEVSQRTVANGLLQTAAGVLRASLPRLYRERTQIGIITYDGNLQFYCIRVLTLPLIAC